MNRIILLGFRYSGKSTIGQALSKKHNLKFIDIDKEIERRQNKTITEIVTKSGWKYFRELELNEYKSHLNEDNIVISCGGGFAVNEYLAGKENELLKQETGLKILLSTDIEAIKERITYDFNNNKNCKNRPSFDKNNKQLNDIINENIDVFKKREKLYNSIDFDCKIDTSNIKISKEILKCKLFCVVGYPVWHSLSPEIHNFLYKIQNLNNFVYTKCEIKPEKIEKLKEIIQFFNFRGLSITSPCKQEVMKIVNALDKKAKQIDAVNTIIVDSCGRLHGYNTDYIGVLNALEENTDLKNKKVAIFGSGGGAKSAVIACLERTKNVVLFNRTKEKNHTFAKQNNIKNCSLDEFLPQDFDIIINATRVGLGTKDSILKRSQILEKHIVFDMVYNPLKTTLLKHAISKGAKVIYGTNMLIHQAIKQHEIYTKQTASPEQVLQVKNEIFKTNHNICLVVIAKTFKEMLSKLKIAQQKSDFIELRCDHLNTINKTTIEKIAEKVCVDTIFTCRSIKDGGNFKGTLQEQQSIIKYAMSLNKFSHFDIDFSQIESWKSELQNKEKQYKIILSHHDFKKCLSYQNCVKIIDKMFENGADIAKIACKIIKHEDILTMLKILEKYKKENKQVIFAPMCENKIVRILASEYGSWTNFVCLNNKETTAKGQICIDNYDKIVDLLR